MEYSHLKKLKYGIRHRMKEKRNKERKTERKKNRYDIKTDVFKKNCTSAVVRDCITRNSKAMNNHPA
jgi:hypothetical protein